MSEQQARTDQRFDLALVTPVYNEEECIADVINSWHAMLKDAVPNHRMIVLNDGSKDNTAGVLEQFAGNPHIHVVNKANSGHGPTILMGYREAVEVADWVFQVDSDNEMPPEAFPKLWADREHFDFLFGIRGGREQNLGRFVITRVSRLAVWALFGGGVKDVNVPYRLMRAGKLRPILEQIPDDTFAPNIVISGLAAYQRNRINNYDVTHRNRQTGSVSIVKWKLWKAAMRAFRQTVRIGFSKRR